MKVHNLFLLNLIFFISFSQIFSKAEKDNFTFGIRYRSIDCRAHNDTILLRYCFLKAYSRRIVIANIGVTFIKSLKNPFYIEIVYKYRYGTIYGDVIHSPKIEWCGVMSGAASNPIISSLMDEVKDSISELLHKCPYEGDIDIKNITSMHEKAASMFWDGFYKFELFIWKENVEIFFLSIGSQCKTDIKESFG